jgi:hypothetical protein
MPPTVLHDMNDYYHQCLNVCRSLHAKGVAFTLDPLGVTTTADKLIYSHAIEMVCGHFVLSFDF